MSCQRAFTASVTTACSPAQPAPTTSPVSARCSQCHSSRSMPSRLPTQSPNSRKRPSIPALAAAAACASSRPSCGANSPMLREALSTARPRCRPRSESTPHDNLTATPPKSRSPVCSLLSRPQWGALQCCVHHTTTTPIFPHTPARTSQKRLASALQRHRTPPSQPRRRSQLWPVHGQIPIAQRAAPPNTCPFPRFRPLEVFGRRPRCVGKCSWRPASENLHNTRHPNICELDLERSRGALAGTLLWEHGFGANHEPKLVFSHLALPVALPVRFSCSPGIAHIPPGSSAFAAGQVKRQVTPTARNQGRPCHPRCVPSSLP